MMIYNIEDTGSMNMQLTLALLVAWVIVFLCVFTGVKWSGKVIKIFNLTMQTINLKYVT